MTVMMWIMVQIIQNLVPTTRDDVNANQMDGMEKKDYEEEEDEEDYYIKSD